ncbi:MAG: hypothetical protein LBC93_02815, partial [Synergistaceae bacterium]|nr:hypothetical protein [Synergistaceae bacterium]
MKRLARAKAILMKDDPENWAKYLEGGFAEVYKEFPEKFDEQARRDELFTELTGESGNIFESDAANQAVEVARGAKAVLQETAFPAVRGIGEGAAAFADLAYDVLNFADNLAETNFLPNDVNVQQWLLDKTTLLEGETILSTMSQTLAKFAAGGKLLGILASGTAKAVGLGKAVQATAKFQQAHPVIFEMLKSQPVNQIVSDPHGGTIFNWMGSIVPSLQGPLLQYLSINGDESEWEARLKSAAANGALDLVLQPVLYYGSKWLKGELTRKNSPPPPSSSPPSSGSSYDVHEAAQKEMWRQFEEAVEEAAKQADDTLKSQTDEMLGAASGGQKGGRAGNEQHLGGSTGENTAGRGTPNGTGHEGIPGQGRSASARGDISVHGDSGVNNADLPVPPGNRNPVDTPPGGTPPRGAPSPTPGTELYWHQDAAGNWSLRERPVKGGTVELSQRGDSVRVPLDGQQQARGGGAADVSPPSPSSPMDDALPPPPSSPSPSPADDALGAPSPSSPPSPPPTPPDADSGGGGGGVEGSQKPWNYKGFTPEEQDTINTLRQAAGLNRAPNEAGVLKDPQVVVDAMSKTDAFLRSLGWTGNEEGRLKFLFDWIEKQGRAEVFVTYEAWKAMQADFDAVGLWLRQLDAQGPEAFAA